MRCKVPSLPWSFREPAEDGGVAASGGSVPYVSLCGSLARGLLLLCFTDDLPLCRVYGCPGVMPCVCLPGAAAGFWSQVHLSFAALGSCVLQVVYRSRLFNNFTPPGDKRAHIHPLKTNTVIFYTHTHTRPRRMSFKHRFSLPMGRNLCHQKLNLNCSD
ncbi:hypothetical protein ILYODFUR_007993 [Ilyodon furcidens]|uniref:Uncharacterized protein n=1 Tax=Ilyodon furcidens TaxID=33524 RepID=A0ABV0TX12_9TELE